LGVATAAFRDNEIDDGVLPSLTTEALSDVAGIGPLRIK
jgi:hypothetical protein